MSGLPIITPARAAADGFEEVLVVDVPKPTALAFTPDGRLLIASQFGKLFVHDPVSGDLTTAMDLTGKVCADREQGFLALALDPAFSSNGFFYSGYTFNKSGDCADSAAVRRVNRISRFTMTPEGVVAANTERVLLDNMPAPNDGLHGVGDLEFGQDGLLYVSMGDGGCDFRPDSSCQMDNNAARDLSLPLGKILRIHPDGALPADNPFLGASSERCNVSGFTDVGKVCAEIYSYGLRNPFRMAAAPNGDIYANDVGFTTWEEINLVKSGADYGWNVREGRCATDPDGFSDTACDTQPAGMTPPLYEYVHDDSCWAITTGVFVPPGSWPASYDDSYLFGDLTCQKLFQLVPGQNGYARSEVTDLLGPPIDMAFGPYGDTQALYYASYHDQVKAIRYVGSANRSPMVEAHATPTAGRTPLAVSFDASQSTDPDGDSLVFDWDFGDGSAHSNEAAPRHTYANPGTYHATVRVTDPSGATAVESIRVDPGNDAPEVRIENPSSGARYRLSEPITLRGSAKDLEDGPLPPESLTWKVDLRHNSHTHPYLPPTSGDTISLVMPRHDENSATSRVFFEIELTATDSQGVSTRIARELLPVPKTEITSGPERELAVRSADLAFTTKDFHATFQCSLDGAALTPCSSPQHFDGLSEGPHEFAVVATDSEGDVDPAPTTRSWVVDVTPPETSITAGPQGPTSSKSATFEFGAPGETDPTFRCAVDDAAPSPCTSPLTLTGLPDGSHKVAVAAVDKAGNADTTPASRTWVVDTTPPQTVITEGPEGTVAAREVELRFSATGDSPVTFRCSLDGAPWSACASPVRYSNLSDSQHTFGVAAVDSAGNVDPSPAGRAWTIDTGAPDAVISAGPEGIVGSRNAEFRFAVSGDTDASFRCALDDAPWSRCTSPVSYENLGDGQHVFKAEARDPAGNVDPSPATRTWFVDTTAPEIPLIVAGGEERFQVSPTFEVMWRGDGATYDVEYTERYWDSDAVTTTRWFQGTDQRTAGFTGEPGHTYCFRVRAADAQANASGWSDESCTTLPLNEDALERPRLDRRSSHWTVERSGDYYLGDTASSRTRDSSLRFSGIHRATHLAAMVEMCPECGRVRFLLKSGSGTSTLRTVNLSRPERRPGTLVHIDLPEGTPSEYADLVIKVISGRGRPVRIDALALDRRP